MKKRSGSLLAALRACLGVPQMEPHARALVADLAKRNNGKTAAVAIELGVSERHARRLLSAYGCIAPRSS